MIFFPAMRHVTLQNLWFSSHKAIKQYILGLNNVKLCCTNQNWPFGTTKSVLNLKNFHLSFFQAFDFFPISKPFDSILPPLGGITQLYTSLQNCPMFVGQLMFLRLHRFNSNRLMLDGLSWQWGRQQVAVGTPTGGCGTAHRRRWDRPQAAVGPPTGGSGTTHRRQWDRLQAAVRRPIGGSEVAHRRQWGCPQVVVKPPIGGQYLQHRFVQLLLLEMFYELLLFFFMPNQVFVEHIMAKATSYTYLINRKFRCVCINQLIKIFYLDINIRIFHVVNFVNSLCRISGY